MAQVTCCVGRLVGPLVGRIKKIGFGSKEEWEQVLHNKELYSTPNSKHVNALDGFAL